MKRIFVLLILPLILSWPSSAGAEGSGMYLAPKFLMSFQNTGPLSKSGSLSGAGVKEYSQFTLGGALAAGYDFWPQQMFPIRVELELALRGNSEKEWDSYRPGLRSVKGVWNNTTLFGNIFWDFHNDSNFTPYIGGGLGLAFNYTGYDFKAPNGDCYSLDGRSTNFAWNAGVGIAYNFNDFIALDASYRFVGLGYNEPSSTFNGVKYEIGNEPYNNEFALGLRFNF